VEAEVTQVKPNGLLVAVIVLAAIGGGVYWTNKHKADEAKKPPSSANESPKVLTIPEADFKEIKIAKKDAEPTIVAKTGDKWSLTLPKAMPADQDAVNSMVTSLASLTADRVVEEKPADLAPFGLTSPKEQVIITKKDGKTATLEIGDDSPVGSGVFAKLAGDSRVFVIPTYTKSNFDKTGKDLRDKRLLTFDSDKLTSLELTAKGQTVGFGKNAQNDWTIVKPKPMRADGSQVEDIIRKLKDAKMDTSVSDEDAKKAQAAFAGAPKVADVKVTDNTGSQTMEVRKDKDKNYYAKTSAVEGTYKIASDLGDALDKSSDDFRSKKLFDFGFSEPTKVQLQNATYQKTGEKWMSGSTEMDSISIQGLIDKLRELAATKFVDTGAGAPVFEAAVTANDSKNNPRTEKVTITKDGDKYYATRASEPGVYELDSKAVDDLQKAASGVKPAAKAKK
jgi:hypothetical protein